MDARAQTANTQWLWPLRIALVLPALLILLAAVPRLVSGLAQEAAFPAEPYMQMDVPLTQDFYAATARILSQAPSADGDTRLWLAEALARNGRAHDAADAAEAALSRVPASARGWIVLAEALQDSDPKKAADALALSLELAPREYFLIPPRVKVGAAVWGDLPASAQDRLLDDTRWLIANERMRPVLRQLLAAKGGPALVTRALAGHPDELRALNRSFARERLGLH